MGLSGLRREHGRLIQSATAYGAALLVSLSLHEFAHGLAARLYGLHATVYGLREQDVASGTGTAAVIAAAGPVASLVLGAMFLAIHKRLRGQGFARYFTMWTGLLGIAIFMGYLLTAPFYPEGDIYKVMVWLGTASPVFLWISFAVGGVGTYLLARIGLPCLLSLANSGAPLRPQLMAMGVLTWVVGSALVLLAMIPALPIMVVAMGSFAPLMNLVALERRGIQIYGEPRVEPRVSVWGIGLLVAMVALEQTFLRWGVRL